MINPFSTNTQKPEPVSRSTPPTSLRPTSVSIYAQHSRGLWQPTHPVMFIVMMSTYTHADTALSNGTVVPLAYCPTLQDAHKALTSLTRQYGDTRVNSGSKWGCYFNVTGKNKTRTFWVKEVGHARALRMTDFDELDGGLGDDLIEDVGVGEHSLGAYADSTTTLAAVKSGENAV